MSAIGASSQELEIARVLRAKTAEQLAMARRQLDLLHDEVGRYERIIAGFDALFEANGSDDDAQGLLVLADDVRPDGGASTGPDGQTLSGKAAVAEVIREAGRTGLTADELAERMMARGWLARDLADPKGAARVSFSRLKKSDSSFRSRDGRYYYVGGAD